MGYRVSDRLCQKDAEEYYWRMGRMAEGQMRSADGWRYAEEGVGKGRCAPDTFPDQFPIIGSPARARPARRPAPAPRAARRPGNAVPYTRPRRAPGHRYTVSNSDMGSSSKMSVSLLASSGP